MASEAQITKLIRAAERAERCRIMVNVAVIDAARRSWSPEARRYRRLRLLLHLKAMRLLAIRRAQAAHPEPSTLSERSRRRRA